MPPTPQKMAHNQKITPKLWDEILLYYVTNPNQHAKASARFGIGKRALTKYYYEGCPSLGKPPMKELLNKTEIRARALRRQAAEDKAREAELEMQAIVQSCEDPDLANSVLDAAEARAHEGMLISAGRRNLIGMHTILARVIAGINQRAPDLEKAIADPKEMTPKQLLTLVTTLGKLIGDVQAAAKNTMEMERMILGEPTEIFGFGNKQMDATKAQQILALANKTFHRLNREGRATLVSLGEEPPDLAPASADGTEEALDVAPDTVAEDGPESQDPAQDEGPAVQEA